MKNLSKEFRRALYYGDQEYLVFADITLTDNTLLELTNSDIWTGGFSYEEAVSEDDNFTAIGSVIIGSANLIINNIYETFSEYDFYNAEAVLYIGMQFPERLEKIKIGTYRVDLPTYNGATITLPLLDNIEQFDRPYTLSTLTYPASLLTIVQDCCTRCGVTLATDSLNFPHKSYEIAERPSDESITFREVLSWCATIAGCFVKCNPNGELQLKWFDTDALDNYAADLDGGTFNPWSAGTQYNGGTFNPWSTGETQDGGSFLDESGVHNIYSLYSQNISVDDIVITGVSVTIKDEDENSNQDIITYNSGTSGYVIELEENPFITKTNAQTIVNWIGAQIIGLRFRKLNVSHSSDPAIESGDVAVVVDRKQNVYRALITRMSFSADGDQTIVCGASTPSRNSATRFATTTKSYVEARKLLRQQKTTYDQALAGLSAAISAKSGLYSHIEPTQSGNIYYLHDKPNLVDSKIVWKMTSEAIAVTTDYNGANPSATVWNFGVQVNGTVIASIMNTIGINFDWDTGGTLTLGGDNDTNGWLKLLDASGTEIGRLDRNGANLTGDLILKKSIGSNIFSNAKIGTFSSVIPGQSSPFTLVGLYLNNTGSSLTTYFAIATGYYWGSAFYETTVYLISNKNITICSNSSASEAIGGWLDLNSNGFGLGRSAGSSCIDYTTSGATRYLGLGPTRTDYFRIHTDHVYIGWDTEVHANFTVSGTKNREVKTNDYSDRLLYCYETTSPLFGDIGEGKISDDGYCYIQIDPILLETINTNQYQVFLQKYGEGDCYIKERHSSYFIVAGTAGLEFGWELKAKQRDFDQLRLEKNSKVVSLENEIDYGAEALEHLISIQKSREVQQ